MSIEPVLEFDENNLMKDAIRIGTKTIDANSPVFIIAEIGVNHNGDLDLAKTMVTEAKRCGADCVKFQTFKADRVVTHDAPKAHYQMHTTNPEQSQLKMLEAVELSHEQHRQIMAHAKNEDLVFMSTPYNREDVDFLEGLDVPAYKLASISCAEPSFIEYVAATGKPVILSTGMATLSEVDGAVRALRNTGNHQVIVLQCTTNYPSRVEDANIRAMVTMGDALSTWVGYSDHTENDIACIMSVALGARLIEKHFTTDQHLPGPDHSSSSTPDAFCNLVSRIRQAEQILGDGLKQPCEIEITNSTGMRRSLVAASNIEKNAIITDEMITLKRPATGMNPSLYHHVIGKRAAKHLARDKQITMDDILH